MILVLMSEQAGVKMDARTVMVGRDHAGGLFVWNRELRLAGLVQMERYSNPLVLVVVNMVDAVA
ncbi:hypothetical protein KDI_25720 [Dictyobacter arantiisoli]|uniref:Uncharacterized protein n=1 Tax=Dictyobacter arantiisoli TaxID=2014874 RepID=A0A5A5TC99_9CHLR|nr:hypothetical protein KDI_25720 [Dictyobacter arantiisoli]